MEKLKRKNSEKSKYDSAPIEPALPDNARAIAIFVTCLVLCVPTWYAGILVLLDYGWQCQTYTSTNAMLSIYALMLLMYCLIFMVDTLLYRGASSIGSYSSQDYTFNAHFNFYLHSITDCIWHLVTLFAHIDTVFSLLLPLSILKFIMQKNCLAQIE